VKITLNPDSLRHEMALRNLDAVRLAKAAINPETGKSMRPETVASALRGQAVQVGTAHAIAQAIQGSPVTEGFADLLDIVQASQDSVGKPAEVYANEDGNTTR
jgi:hypothetical protein